MAEYDGSIRIGTGIDEKGFKAGSKDLENGARRLAKSVSDSLGDGAKIALQKQTDAFAKLNRQYADQEQKVRGLASKLHDLQREKVETEEFKALSKDLDRAKASLDRLYDRRDAYVELGKKTPPKLELDISDAERKIKILEADIKDLISEDKAYLPVDTTKVQSDLAAAEQKQMQMYTALQTSADALTQKISAQAVEEERIAQIRARAVASNDEIIAKVERIRQLEQEIADLEAAETTLGYADYEDAIRELAELKQEIRAYRDEIVNFQEDAVKYIDKSSEAWKKYQATLEQARNTQTGMVSLVEAIKAALTYMADVVKEKMLGLAAVIKNGVTHPFQTLKNMASGTLNGMKSGILGIGKVGKKVFSVIGMAAKKAFSGMAAMAKKAFSAITSSSKQSNASLSGGLKTILKYGLGIRSVYALFSKLKSGMQEGFKNLMGYSDSFANSVQSVKNSMSTLGNQIAGAFRPVVEMVIPWLNQLISALSTAMTHVAQFIAVLGGSSTFTKAKKVQDSYNKSLGGTAKAADKARGALAKFDDLDVLEKKEDASGGAGGLEETLPKDMFEEAEIDGKWKNIADWFREMWVDADFSELGAVVGEKIKSALESIPWDSIQQTVSKAGESFATLMNGIVEVSGLALDIGKTIGEAINTGITGINSFLDNTNWGSVGQFIGEGLNGLVDTIDWGGLGHLFAEKWNAVFETIGEASKTFDWKNFGASLAEGFNTWVEDFDWAENGAYLGEVIKGLLDTIITFIEETDWQELGNKAADFIGSIDWTGIMERLSEGIGAALGGLAAFLWGLIEDAWNSVVEWWNEAAFEDGEFTMEGLLNGIWEGIKNIGAWIEEHIFQPFIDGFKKAFGIHSPSTVMEEMGTFITKGLLNGISSLVDSVKEVWNNLKTSTVKIFDGIWTAIKGVINSILGGVEKMANGVVNAINAMIRALNAIHFDIPDWVPALGGKSFGFSIGEIPSVTIPKLATGAVIRGGNPFMAILGDQPAGKTNIEAPADLIKDMVKQGIAESGYGNQQSVPVNINLIYDGETFARLSIPDILSELGRQGYNVDLLGYT